MGILKNNFDADLETKIYKEIDFLYETEKEIKKLVNSKKRKKEYIEILDDRIYKINSSQKNLFKLLLKKLMWDDLKFIEDSILIGSQPRKVDKFLINVETATGIVANEENKRSTPGLVALVGKEPTYTTPITSVEQFDQRLKEKD